MPGLTADVAVAVALLLAVLGLAWWSSTLTYLAVLGVVLLVLDLLIRLVNWCFCGRFDDDV